MKKNKIEASLRNLLGVSAGLVLLSLVGCAGSITSEPEPECNVDNAATTNEIIIKGKPDNEFLAAQPEQKYIVRFAHIYEITDSGVVYEDTDGNLWEVNDPPETGMEVRLFFDSNETVISTDDVIIDITEVK